MCVRRGEGLHVGNVGLDKGNGQCRAYVRKTGACVCWWWCVCVCVGWAGL